MNTDYDPEITQGLKNLYKVLLQTGKVDYLQTNHPEKTYGRRHSFHQSEDPGGTLNQQIELWGENFTFYPVIGPIIGDQFLARVKHVLGLIQLNGEPEALRSGFELIGSMTYGPVEIRGERIEQAFTFSLSRRLPGSKTEHIELVYKVTSSGEYGILRKGHEPFRPEAAGDLVLWNEQDEPIFLHSDYYRSYNSFVVPNYHTIRAIEDPKLKWEVWSYHFIIALSRVFEHLGHSLF